MPTTKPKKGNHATPQPLAEAQTMLPVEVTCRGITPLLMHRMPEDRLLGLRGGAGRKPKNAPVLLPRDEAALAVYELPQGGFFLPTANLMAALISAGKWIRLDGKRQLSTRTETLLPAFMSIQDPYLPLETPGWEVDLARAVNSTTKASVCAVRPRFDLWAFTTHILIDVQEIAEQTIRQLFDYAGRREGLGAWRPSRRGMYGQFVVEHWRAVAAE